MPITYVNVIAASGVGSAAILPTMFPGKTSHFHEHGKWLPNAASSSCKEQLVVMNAVIAQTGKTGLTQRPSLVQAVEWVKISRATLPRTATFALGADMAVACLSIPATCSVELAQPSPERTWCQL